MDICDTIELGLHREAESRERLQGSDEFKSDDCKEEKITNRQALWTLIWNSLPACGALLVRRAVELINYMVVGRMDDPDYISGVGLGIITSSIVCFSIGIGLAGGIETLSSQAFGNKSYYLAGCYYNRAQVILTVLFILQGVVLYYSADILIFIGEPVKASEYAGIYIRTNLPGIWAYCQTELLRRFLCSQGEFNLVLKIQIVTTVLHPLWVYIFVGSLNLYIVGIAVATCITYILNFVIGTVYITLNKSVVKEGSWHCINRDSFRGIIEYLRYGIPSMIMIILESWCFEGLIIMSGFLGVNQLGASVITLNFQGIIYLVSLGGSISTSSIIGNSLGASNPENAKKYTNMGIILSLILSVIKSVSMQLRK